jgi:hypothetical protein
MPRAEIASNQAIFALTQLHAELAGKFAESRNAGVQIKTAIMQVEAVLQMLQPRPQSFPLGGPTQYTKTVLKPASRLTGPCQ